MMRDLLPENGSVRKLWPGDADIYREHLLRLDPDSRNARFGGGVSDQFIRDYVTTTAALAPVMHGFFVDGVLRGVAELRPVLSAADAQAEAAFSIEKPWQSHGVGSALLSRTLIAARNRGIRALHMICLADNQRMQQLARKFDAALTFEYGSVVGALETPYPTPLTLWREAVADTANFATAMLDVPSRVLRARPR